MPVPMIIGVVRILAFLDLEQNRTFFKGLTSLEKGSLRIDLALTDSATILSIQVFSYARQMPTDS